MGSSSKKVKEKHIKVKEKQKKVKEKNHSRKRWYTIKLCFSQRLKKSQSNS